MRITTTLLLSLCAVALIGQTAPAPTLGLEHGTLDFDTPAFTVRLVKDSQTMAALEPKGARGRDPKTPFDFTPADQLQARQGNRFNHLGDITLRVKRGSRMVGIATSSWPIR